VKVEIALPSGIGHKNSRFRYLERSRGDFQHQSVTLGRHDGNQVPACPHLSGNIYSEHKWPNSILGITFRVGQ
jgi:hypothetical protein